VPRLFPIRQFLSWRMYFFSTTRFALHWMANKAPLKHFERIATYRCRYFELMTACFLGQMVKASAYCTGTSMFFLSCSGCGNMEHDHSMKLVRISTKAHRQNMNLPLPHLPSFHGPSHCHCCRAEKYRHAARPLEPKWNMHFSCGHTCYSPNFGPHFDG